MYVNNTTANFKTEMTVFGDKDSVNAFGKLTLKGITKSINIPLTISTNGKARKINAKVSIHRTKYGIKYNSKSFFGNLGYKAIKNNFELVFLIEMM